MVTPLSTLIVQTGLCLCEREDGDMDDLPVSVSPLPEGKFKSFRRLRIENKYIHSFKHTVELAKQVGNNKVVYQTPQVNKVF